MRSQGCCRVLAAVMLTSGLSAAARAEPEAGPTIETINESLSDGVNRCPKCGSTDVQLRASSGMLVCLFCRHQWQEERVEEELGWEFIQIYGLTETSPLLTVNRARSEWDDLPAEERAQRLGRAGTPALGVRLKTDAEGEVLARSNVVLEGYWEQPEESERALRDGWFHTGDGGVIDDEGYLTISDRKKDVIITGGENVSSIEVEDVLFSHPAVAEVCVIGVPDDRWGETIKALVVLAEGESATEADLIAHCKARLAGYKAPTSVELREAIPRTATGKVQKFKLRQQYWEGRERQVN